MLTCMTSGLLKGNCLEQLLLLPDNSVDSVITDPPYELGFMGKGWDASGIAYNVEVWKQCFRVLKPGGHLLAFGGTRTYHRIAVAIEDAGFEIRDSVHWTYGSGFPKSMDVSKAIDKAAGAKRTEVIGTRSRNVKPFDDGNGWNSNSTTGAHEYTAPATDLAKKWSGWGTAMKPSHEPVVVARKPLSEKTVAKNVVKWGTGALNIDGTRVGMGDDRSSGGKSGSAPSEVFEDGFHTERKERPEGGRWPANTILTHSANCELVGTANDSVIAGERTANFGTQETQSGGNGSGNWGERSMSVDVWNCAPDCPTQMFPDTGKSTGGRIGKKSQGSVTNVPAGQYEAGDPGYGDEGSVARYFTNTSYQDIDFPPFIYQAKASSRERNAGLGELETKQTVGGGGLTNVGDKFGSIKAPAKNFHPTVKPVSLMRHLVRLVTPQGGLVLDPFLGSGTTAVAAVLENCQWVGCELTEDYWGIIEGRTEWAQAQVETPTTTQEALF